MDKVELIAKEQNQRAFENVFLIVRRLQEGDNEGANEVFVAEKNTFESRLRMGSRGATLTRLQGLGLIDELDQEKLTIPGRSRLIQIEKIIKSKLSDESLKVVEERSEVMNERINRP